MKVDTTMGIVWRTVAASVLITFLTHAQAAEWADLTGTFVYGGDAPKPAALKITKDEEVCGPFNLVDTSLVVNPENKGLSNVVLFLFLNRGDKAPEVHESYEADANAQVTFDNLHCEFQPRIGLLRTTQTLLIGNKDPIGHNTKIDLSRNTGINPIIPANGEQSFQFKEEERTPAPVSCSIHPWMQGYLLVRENPYFAVTDENGKFTIKNLPTGKWTFQVWHEKAGYIEDVQQNGKKVSWRRGRLELDVDGDGVDLGSVEVPAAAFK